MSEQTKTRKTTRVPVIMYPEGIIVGHVRSGKNSAGKVRHVATTADGVRFGTFDQYREASDALIADARRVQTAKRILAEEEATPEPTAAEHRVELVEAPEQRQQYGIRYLSRYVFEARKRYSSPTRIVVWDNTGRLNPRNGEGVRHGQYGLIDGGNGRYLDPSNRATDEPTSVHLTPEASVITNNGTNTGTEASGQVFAPAGTVIREGDRLVLVYPDGAEVVFTARFTSNGHGHLDYVRTEHLPTPTPARMETPAQRRERFARELVAETLAASADHRYARAYGILAGLVRGLATDASSAELAREYVRQMDAAKIA